MPRKPRFYLPGMPVHVVQRGNARRPTFFTNQDYVAYLDWLRDGSRRHGCQIHAYVLMTNHVHLLLTPEQDNSVSRMIQDVGRRYVTYVNRKYGASGTLWEGRHKGCVIDSDAYLLACMRYIELNPLRAGMVAVPGDYRWSSYRANALGEGGDGLTRHAVYATLGASADERCSAYRALFEGALDASQVDAIRATVQTGTPLGDVVFKRRIEERLRRRVGQARRGRPEKRPEDSRAPSEKSGRLQKGY